MQYDYILICGTGRSGSTTLLRILNTIPDTNICGENNSAIRKLLEFYEAISYKSINNNNYDDLIKNNEKPCWYNCFDYNVILRLLKHLINSFLNKKNDPKIKTIGFKEIRYGYDIHLVSLFKKLFPNTKVLINIRKDIFQQSKSAWWGENSNSLNELQNINKTFIDFYENNRDYTYMFTLEDMLDISKIKELFTFIGKEKYFNVNEIAKILENPMEHK